MKIVTFLGSIFSWLWVVLLVVVVGLVVAGCVAGTKVDPAPKGGGEVGDAKVVIHLRMPGDFRPTGSTRGLTADDEKAIDNMWVLMFDTADRLLAIERAAMLVNSSYSVGLPPVPQGSQVKLVLVANAEDILEGTIGFIPENIPGGASRYNEIMPMIGEGISAPLFMNSGARIPMWGESDLVTVMPGMVVDRTVPLMRSVARVDIGVGQHTRADDGTFSWNGLTGPTGEASSKAIPFEMTAVYVVRPNNRYNVAPVLRNVDFSFPASPKATAPSVPVGATGLSVPASQANFRYEVDGLYTTQDIYVPEADIVMGGGDSDHRNRMALVVEGRYDQNGNGNYAEEPLSYYRVDFGNDKTFDNVLRNRLYSFSIQGVISTGQPTVETAYNSHAMNMSVSVVDWDQGSISNVWFDGPLYFAIDRQDVVFGPLRGGVEEMRIRTNIPEFEFYYRNNDSDTPEFSVDSPVFIDGKGYEYELIRVSPGEAADDEYILRIENPRDNVSATHDPAARLVDWVIRAGGTLRINYHVDQRWTNEYSSLADRQGTFLGPEGFGCRAQPYLWR